MKPGSLRLRLVFGGAIAIVAALLIAGFGLSILFERHVMRSLTDDLEIDVKQAIAAIELDGNGQPFLTREPSNPRFAEPLSGLYWQLSTDSGPQLRSRSLWDTTLPLPKDALEPGDVHHHRVDGPGGSALIAVEKIVTLKYKDTRAAVRLVFATDIARVDVARRAFIADLVPSLGLLGLVLAAAAWVQISLGLRPLARVRDGIAAIRSGHAANIDGTVPSEVEPLVEEINGLVSAQERDLERARGRAADLAHGLKTPLSALAADVRSLRERGDIDLAARIEDVGEAMRRHIERELARVRIRGKRGFSTVAPTPVRPLLDTLIAIQRRTEPGQRLTFDVDASSVFDIAIDKADLAEVLGNLLENASRHARIKVRVRATDDHRIVIEDDGPGVPEDLRDWVLARGRRLDERPDGAGLGLAIVQEVLAAYDRRLTLDTSPLGGLRVTF